MTPIFKYYKFAALYPLVFIIVATFAAGLIHEILGLGKDYKSEWSTNDGFILSMFFAIFDSAFLCLMSTTLFLNKYKEVRNLFLLSFLTWFVLPGFFIGRMLYAKLETYHGKFDSENIFVLAITLPHLIGLCTAFIKFQGDKDKFHQMAPTSVQTE